MGEDQREFSLEDILAEERKKREQAAEQPTEEPVQPTEEAEEVQAEPLQEQPAEAAAKENYVPYPPAPEEETADLNSFATGQIQVPGYGQGEASLQQQEAEPEETGKGKKKKKKKGGLFGRKKRKPDFDEAEDMYYGIQLKPLDEYRKGFDPVTGEFKLGAESFEALFDDSKKAIDDEVEANFQKLQQERRRRVAQAVQSAGVDEQAIADEFGIVAPMPVTAFAADPYAKQHGIGVEGETPGEEMPDIQKAMLQTSTDKTMEIKLNVLNDTVEIQRVKDLPKVGEEAVEKIQESAQAHQEQMAQQEQAVQQEEAAPAQQPEAEMPAQPQQPEAAAVSQPAPAAEPVQQAAPQQQTAPARQPQPVIRPLGEIPQVESIYKYRVRGIPTHIINVDVLQSALLSESEMLHRMQEKEERKNNPRRRVRNKKLEEEHEEAPPTPDADTGESIDDYTGPEDIKAISRELSGDMHELSLRMLITGVCTVLLAIVNMIFGSQFASTPAGELGASPTVYFILTMVFLVVSIGICYRTIGNGLRALLSFEANSDSAVAVAAAAVLIQTISSLFFSAELTDGKLHLYAVVLSAILFVNTLGKKTMIRRIHGNFRFMTSKDQKYSVRLYDDYNTALKMTKDCVSEKPVMAYQCKAGFLKRFLELSYTPDPAETASQFFAPIGLIASLVLCIVCLLVSKSVPTALSALAASACACVAVGNMLVVNNPISRICKIARRAGAMVVGYEGVEELGDVNAVLVDAEEIFPVGTVVLNGIRTFGGRAEAGEAVMAASALMREVGGPLAGVFDQVISENEDALPKVENITFEEGHGVTGWVDGREVCIGNRAFLVNHQIASPAKDEESQYSSANKQVIYIAMDHTVAALMILTYSADRRKKNELQRLEDNGISIVIRTTDVNVTPQLVARLFGLETSSVGVLSAKLGDEAGKLMGQEIPRADAKVATKGKVESMMSVISACVSERRTIRTVVLLQTVAVVLGFALVAFMACFGGMQQLSSFVLFVFELFCLAVQLAVPRFMRR